MNQKIIETGTFTALVTPFKEGKVDVEALRNLVEFQINAGISGLVPCGTTGESPTLSDEEYRLVVSTVVESAANRVPVIAGAGANSTAHAIHLAKIAKESGADATLQVSPYYNKPTQEGLFRHFEAIAKAVEIPHIIYNIQGRCGVNIMTGTLARLAQIPNIIGVKEASGSLPQMMEVISELPDDFIVLSGDDNLTLPLIAVGGRGVISVLSNLMPAEVNSMVQSALQGDMQSARSAHYRLMPFFNAMFCETNPIPVKYAMASRGLIAEEYRLPMTSLSIENKKFMDEVMRDIPQNM